MFKRMADWHRELAGRFPKIGHLFEWVVVWCGRIFEICKNFPSNFKKLRVWIKKSPDGLKRLADILEKLGVGTFAVGLLQGNYIGIPIGLVCLYASFCITHELEGKNKC